RINKFGEAVAFMPVPRARPGDLMYDEAADTMIIDAPSVATETGGAQ
ncbi:MAG: hypothetical protein JJ893_17925, partial [Thalassospira sp.]|nr:hypothetical protein [Thalassospira sp.]